MARASRGFLDGGVYRIWARGLKSRLLFRDPEDYVVYLKALSCAKQRSQLRLYHYTLLRNEVHLLVHVPQAHVLSSTLQHTHLTFHWHHRRKYGTTERLWHDRFQHQAVATEELLRVGHEAEWLPVRTGLVTHPEDYPYSSYAHYAFGQFKPSLDTNPQYVQLAPAGFRRQEQYRQLARAAA